MRLEGKYILPHSSAMNSRASSMAGNRPKEKSSADDKPIVDIASYVSLNRGILKLVGLYPQSGARSLTVGCFMLLIVVPQLMQIYHSADLGVILETSSVLLTIILALLKMIVWSVRRNEVDDLITYMFGHYWNMIDFGDEAASLFLQYAGFSKAFTKCYLILITNALLLFSALPLVQTPVSNIKSSFNETRGLYIFPGLYPEGWTKSPLHEIVLFSQVLATGSCGAVVLAIDTLVAMALFHTCGHFKILQKNLRSLGDDIPDPTSNLKTEESSRIFARQRLCNYIEHHQVTLRFSETVERLFSPIMLCQVLASIMIICLVGLQTIADRGNVLKYIAYLLMALFQLILFCLPGEDLINQSLAVSDAAYAANWYRVSHILESDVKFIIFRGQKPAKITAGKFTVMCLEHFGAVLSTSMSYFTVLRSLS